MKILVLLFIIMISEACSTAQPDCTWQKIDAFSDLEVCLKTGEHLWPDTK